MTPRERSRRCRAYARASKRAHDAFRAAIAGCSGFWNYQRGKSPELDLARDRERHAYLRLPLHVQEQLLQPEGPKGEVHP